MAIIKADEWEYWDQQIRMHWVGRSEKWYNRVSTLLQRDGTTCKLCGEAVVPADLSIDHVIPKAKGGNDMLENLQITHVSCNHRRGARRALVSDDLDNLYAQWANRQPGAKHEGKPFSAHFSLSLAKYGITVDELIARVERRKAQIKADQEELLTTTGLSPGDDSGSKLLEVGSIPTRPANPFLSLIASFCLGASIMALLLRRKL